MHPVGTTLARKMAAKNAIIQETMDLLVEKVTPEAIARAVESALKAETVTKEGIVPDFRTRLEACKIYLNYIVGLPVQRQEIIHKEVRTEEETADAIFKSPAAVRELERRVEEAKERFAKAGIVYSRP